LWLLFFWRLLTPIPGDQASITQGDFSGQFVAFAAYQYHRLTQGEIPLWNPYNNGGLPFIGDTQAAVFYPPRLLTIAFSYLSGGWTYHALELEMMFHVLAYSLLLYALVRRMTIGQSGRVIGGLVAAIIGAYGGFLSGYPVQQLAILEAAIWLPLGILGVLEATRHETIRWRWMVLAGFALGLSWMAGHPQTSWFLTYLLVAYLAYHIYVRRWRWTILVRGIILIALISGGIAAVQLLPGIEYLGHTARIDLTFEAKGNGFPIRDVLQFLFPGQFSLFSPLYIGIVGLALVIIVPWFNQKIPGSHFWIGVALVSLLLSFGANSALYPALYNLLPGLRFFRGQERAAYLVASSLAILAGLSAAHLVSAKTDDDTKSKQIQQTLVGLVIACGVGIVLAPDGWFSERPDEALSTAVFSTLIAAAVFFVLRHLVSTPSSRFYQWLLVGLLVFDLFTINFDADHTYDPVPPNEQLALIHPPLVAQVASDTDLPYRVDGFRGLNDNFGSLYRVMDMRGISPLFLDGPYRLIEPEKINPVAWELFAVRYVFTDWEALPVASTLLGSGTDRHGPVNLHRLTDPRPFAHLVYDVEVVDSDAFAHELVRDPNFTPRTTVILNQPVAVDLPPEAPAEGTAAVTTFEPERFVIEVSTPTDAVLTIAHPDYPGWHATIDDVPAETIRAFGALTAIAVPSGQHEITFTYDPLSYRVGAVLSLFTWACLGILGGWWLIRGRNAD